MSESEKQSLPASARTMTGAMFLTLYEQGERLIDQANASAASIEDRQRQLLEDLDKQNSALVEQYKNNLKRYHEAFLETLNQEHGSIIKLSEEFKRHTNSLKKMESRLRLFLPAGVIFIAGLSFIIGFLASK